MAKPYENWALSQGSQKAKECKDLLGVVFFCLLRGGVGHFTYKQEKWLPPMPPMRIKIKIHCKQVMRLK